MEHERQVTGGHTGVVIDSRRFTAALSLVAIVLLGVYLTYVALVSWVKVEGLRLYQFVDLDAESNPAAWLASSLLLLNAIVLGLLAVTAPGRRDRRRWAVLALLTLLVSFDEAAGLHERMSIALHLALDTSGALAAAWVIPGGILVVAVATVYLRFLLGLARPQD